MPTTLQQFVDHSIWPYISFYLAYAALKYIGLCLVLVLCHCGKREKAGTCDSVSSDDSVNILKKVVDHTFGSLPEKLAADSEKIKKLDDEHALILVVKCISYITITLFIVTKMFWTNVISYSCNTNPRVHCFPQILNENDTHLVPNISIQARINDCSPWTDESFIDRINFICFELTYNIESSVVALGGVVALFNPTMTVITSLAHIIYKTTSNGNKLCSCKCNEILHYIQLAIGILFIPIEFALVIAVLATFGMAVEVDEFFMNSPLEQAAMFFVDHGVVIFFIFGIIHLSFLFPWNRYVNHDSSSRKCSVAPHHSKPQGSQETVV